jgi:hypothetical protein
MKRADLLHNIMTRAREAVAREGIDCELRGADLAGPGEFVLTAWGTPAAVVRLAEALRRDNELQDPQVIEDVGGTNQPFHEADDAGRRRHLHIAVAAPSVW